MPLPAGPGGQPWHRQPGDTDPGVRAVHRAGRPGRQGVNLGIVTDSHGTHVAGITAANGLYGGGSDGQAPGAKLVSVQVCVIGGG